jgi:hypothetical protein
MADQPQPPSTGGDFKKALTKLAGDVAYRNKAIHDPNIITHDFKLSLAELEALRNAAEMSGADLTQVRKVRAQSFSTHATATVSAAAVSAAALRINISCCSCCCCCCGETAVAPMLEG